MAGNTHFHIRWVMGDVARTDWEAFASRDEAELIARRIANPSEIFAIDEFDDSCERCALFLEERNISN
jgi:hypothetical protein